MLDHLVIDYNRHAKFTQTKQLKNTELDKKLLTFRLKKRKFPMAVLDFHLFISPLNSKKLFSSIKSADFIDLSVYTLVVSLLLKVFLTASKPAPWGMFVQVSTAVTRMVPFFKKITKVFNAEPAFLHDRFKNRWIDR